MDINEIKTHFRRIPKAPLGFFPTPLYRLDRLSAELGINLYIKRDDFSGMSLFGGNKIRKLEYLLGDAKRLNCDTVFTYGATQSNHAMQTVTACRRLGLTPILYLVAIVPPDENDLRANLLLDKLLGAEIHIVYQKPDETEADAEERSFLLAREHMARLNAQGHHCYDVPMGGASPIGSAAFIEGYVELYEQLHALGAHPDVIFHATGTGGTMAGLVAGRKLLGDKDTHIVSVNVSAKDDAAYRTMGAELANRALSFLDFSVRTAPEDFQLDLDHYAPGYEQPNPAAAEAIRLLARTEGLLLDPVYTGKAFAGMLTRIRDGRVPQGSNVVFWHTGGATALFAEKEILGEIE